MAFFPPALRCITVAAIAAALPAATVSVKVRNQTPGAPVPVGLAVSLEVAEGQDSRSYGPARTDAAGVARFDIPDVEAEARASATTAYAGVKYESEPALLAPGAPSAEIELPVYETTTSSDRVVVTFHHSVLRPMNGAVQVTEMLAMENRGDRVYVGRRELQPGLRAVFEYALPPGYQQLELGRGLMACCVMQLDGKLIDTMELKPGRRTVQFRYVIPAAEGKLPFQPDIAFATERYSVLVDPALKVESATGLRNSDPAQYETMALIGYEAAHLAPGAKVRVNVAGIPADRALQLRWAAAAAALLLSVFLLVFAMRSRGSAPAHGLER